MFDIELLAIAALTVVAAALAVVLMVIDHRHRRMEDHASKTMRR